MFRRVHEFPNRQGAAPGSGGRIEYPVIEEIQRRTFAVLDTIARTRTFTVAGDLVLTFWGFQQGEGIAVVAGGSSIDRFLYQLIHVLEEVGADRVVMCPAHNCNRFILKVGKRTHCSEKCYGRWYMSMKRARERAEDAAFQQEEKRDGKTTRTR